MNLYNQEELERIDKIKETNDKLEDFFNAKSEEWNKNVNPLFDVLRNNWTLESAPKIIEIQSLALSYRQNINEQISFFLNKRSKEEVKIKKLKQDKFVFYATGFVLKTNLGTCIDIHSWRCSLVGLKHPPVTRETVGSKPIISANFLFRGSSVVELPAVNRSFVGSNPTLGAI